MVKRLTFDHMERPPDSEGFTTGATNIACGVGVGGGGGTFRATNFPPVVSMNIEFCGNR